MKKNLDLYKKYMKMQKPQKMADGGQAKPSQIGQNPYSFLNSYDGSQGLNMPMNALQAIKLPSSSSAGPSVSPMGTTSDSTDPNITGANNSLVTSGQATVQSPMSGGAGDSNPFLSTINSMSGQMPTQAAYEGGKIKGYSDGGDVLSELAEKFKQAFGVPKAAPTPDPTLQEKYQKIRQQNNKNFTDPQNQSLFEGGISGSTHKYQYSEGGEVEPKSPPQSQEEINAESEEITKREDDKKLQNNEESKPFSKGGKVEHDPHNLVELGKAFLKFINEEKSEKKMSSGGQVRHYFDGTDYVEPSDAPAKEMDKRQQVSNAFKNSTIQASNSKPSSSDDSSDQGSVKDFLGFADGGEVDPIAAQLADEQNLEDQQRQAQEVANLDASSNSMTGDSPKEIPVDFAEPSTVTGKTPEDSDDKSLEEEVANEDFKAGEKSDEGKERNPASDKDEDSEDASDSDDSTAEGIHLDHNQALKENPEEKDSAAGLQVSPDIQKAINNISSNPKNDLKKAQNQRDRAIAMQQLNKSAVLLGAGIAGRGGTHVDPSEALKVIGSNDQYANLPVQKYQEQVANQQNDPNSPMSKMSRDYFKSKGFDVPETASAADLKSIAPNYQKDQGYQNALQKVIMQQTGANSRNAATNVEKQNAIDAANKRAAESNALREKEFKDKAENTKLAKQQKASDQENKSLTQTQQLLESARGNPAAAQSEKDLYASQKANSLFNMYKDPNQANNSMFQLYATEIAKMASGGVPSIHELQGLNPNTIPGYLSSAAEKFSSTPTPANKGEFMKQFKSYSDALAKDAQKVIQDKYGRVIESRKNQLGPDNYQTLQENYINRFKPVNSDIPVDTDLSKLSPSELKDYIKLHGGQ